MISVVASGLPIHRRRASVRVKIRAIHEISFIADAVKSAVLAARNLGYSTGPSGTYWQQLFERWGILQTIKDKIVVPPPGIPVGTLVARDECELGFQQMSELMNLPGIDVLGPLPPSIQTLTVFSGGISSGCGVPEDARRVLDYMASPAAAELKRRFGMEAP